MGACNEHDGHDHRHGNGCGHTRVRHGDHDDYLHDGHLHRLHDSHVDECLIAVDAHNPDACTPHHTCTGHEKGHRHGAGCGHEAIPHGEHFDYVVAGHLHHPCDGHCDDHGMLSVG
jgi:hypothetical protein